MAQEIISRNSESKENTILQVDNSASEKLAKNPEYRRKPIHIEIKHEKVLYGKLVLEQTNKHIADIINKPFTKTLLLIICDQMRLYD